MVFKPDENPDWNRDSRRELVDLYLRQMSIASLAEHFDVSQREIVRELSRLLLNVQEPCENKFAENFGAKWDIVGDDKLRAYFRRGHTVAEISRLLGRDLLGICFRILANFDVVVPDATRVSLKLDEYWANEKDPDSKASPARTCVVCEDVIIYCKCQFQDWPDPFK